MWHRVAIDLFRQFNRKMIDWNELPVGNNLVIVLMILQKGHRNKNSDTSGAFTYPPPPEFYLVSLRVGVPQAEKHCFSVFLEYISSHFIALSCVQQRSILGSLVV
jgi:hypothetical protein